MDRKTAGVLRLGGGIADLEDMNDHAPHGTSDGLPDEGSATGSSSSHAFDLVAAALQQVAACMDEACPKQVEAARLIRLGRMDEAFPLMSECVGLWQKVQGSLAAAAGAIGQPVGHLAALVLTPAGEEPRDPLVDLATPLHAIKRAVQGRDWVGLADALEYDLGELAQRWRSALLQPDESESPGSSTTGAAEYSRSAPAA